MGPPDEWAAVRGAGPAAAGRLGEALREPILRDGAPGFAFGGQRESLMTAPIGEYFRFDFGSRTEHVDAAIHLFNYLKAGAGSAAEGPDRPVFWTLASGATLALYLSPGALRAARRAQIVLGAGVRLAAADLPQGLVLVFGDDRDRPPAAP